MESKNFLSSKRAMVDKVYGVVYAVLGIIILVLVVAALWNPLSVALDNLSGSGIPLGFLYGASGVLGLIFAVGIFLLIFKMIFAAVGHSGKKK